MPSTVCVTNVAPAAAGAGGKPSENDEHAMSLWSVNQVDSFNLLISLTKFTFGLHNLYNGTV